MRPSATSEIPRSGFVPAEAARPDSDAGELFDAARASGSFVPDSAIDEQISVLERWAVANLAKDRRDRIRFWILKGAAFVCAGASAVATGFGLTEVSIVLGTTAALAVAVDAAWPASSFRNPHQRAVHDLRELQNTLKLRWDKVRLAHPDPLARERIAHALALLDAVQAKREEIGKYLGSAEPSPGVIRK
jgi:hypothetical protein